MTVSKSETGENERRSRKRGMALAALLAVLTIFWLVATAHQRTDEPQQFFGLWRMRHVLTALAATWLASVFLASAVSRKALFKWLAVSISAALALLLVEVAGHAGLINATRLRRMQQINPYGTKPMPHIDVSGKTYQDIWTRWGIDSPAIPFQFKTDTRGFRNDRDRDDADVYLVGDSLLVAALVPFERTITAQLERNLGRPVMNISLIGLSVQAERDLLMEANPPLKGRLVVHFVFEGNDPLDSRAYRQQKAGENGSAPDVDWKRRSPAYNLLMKLQDLSAPPNPLAARRTGYIGNQPYGFLWVGELVRGTENEFPFIFDALNDTRKFVESAGGRYAVVVVPEKYRVLAPLCRWPEGSDLSDYESNLSPLSAAVVDWCGRERVPVLNLIAPLQKAAREGRIPWFPGDTHLNENGHAVAAEAIAEWIKSQK